MLASSQLRSTHPMQASQMLVRRVFDLQITFSGVLQSFADAPRKVRTGGGDEPSQPPPSGS
jgi:hypothetical protein